MYVPVFLICCCIDVFHCNKECFRLLLGLYIVRNHDLTCLQNLVYLCIFHSVGTPDNNILIKGNCRSFFFSILLLDTIQYYVLSRHADDKSIRHLLFVNTLEISPQKGFQTYSILSHKIEAKKNIQALTIQ